MYSNVTNEKMVSKLIQKHCYKLQKLNLQCEKKLK
jgi:hypothetical protein